MNYFINLSYMISHIFLMIFIYLFTAHRYSKGKTVFICVGTFVMLCLLDLAKLIFYPDSNVCYFIVTVVQIFVTQFTAVFISARRNSRALFMGLSASNYVIAGSIAASVLDICTGDMWVSLLGSFTVHLTILLLLIFRIRKIWLMYLEKEYVSDKWELCLIPVFFYCGFSCLTFFPFTLFDHPENILGTLIFIITMFVSYIVAMRYMESESQRINIYWENALYESYIHGLEDKYHLMERSERNMKILRHDMRHYSDMINSLLDQEEYGEIRKIVKHISEVADENKVAEYCSNLVINTIFASLMERANAMEVKVNHDIRVGKEIKVNSYELAVVLANLFENALNCVKELEGKKRHVVVKVHCTDDYFLIQMENEYGEEIEFDPVSGLPKSRRGRDHGFGMQGAQAFSEKIGGSFVCYCEDGVFHIMIHAKFQGDFLQNREEGE